MRSREAKVQPTQPGWIRGISASSACTVNAPMNLAATSSDPAPAESWIFFCCFFFASRGKQGIGQSSAACRGERFLGVMGNAMLTDAERVGGRNRTFGILVARVFLWAEQTFHLRLVRDWSYFCPLVYGGVGSRTTASFCSLC